MIGLIQVIRIGGGLLYHLPSPTDGYPGGNFFGHAKRNFSAKLRLVIAPKEEFRVAISVFKHITSMP
jgi:hypothetical protein